jgi:hypothetical protein
MNYNGMELNLYLMRYLRLEGRGLAQYKGTGFNLKMLTFTGLGLNCKDMQTFPSHYYNYI